MKKIIFAFVVLMGLNTVVSFADDKVAEKCSSELLMEFVPMDANRLPEQVREELALNYPCCVVSAASYKSLDIDTTIYKVVLSDQENFESCVVLSESGEELELNL